MLAKFIIGLLCFLIVCLAVLLGSIVFRLILKIFGKK